MCGLVMCRADGYRTIYNGFLSLVKTFVNFGFLWGVTKVLLMKIDFRHHNILGRPM